MHELYISPDILSEGEWGVLADALHWRASGSACSRRRDGRRRPRPREPYGYVHFRGSEGIVAVRNPDIAPARSR